MPFALVFLGLFGALGVQPAPALADTPGVYQFTDPNQALNFDGKAWGHGVGLCQWGAHGRALAGQSGEQIVASYYQGTAIQKVATPDTTIRVLLNGGLQLGQGESPRITAQGGAWQLETSGNAAPLAGQSGAYVQLSTGSGGLRYAAFSKDGQKLGEGVLGATIKLHALEAGTRFVIGYKPAADVPGRPGTYFDTYRGDLLLNAQPDGLETVNRLSLEDYLRGVVPSEMPGSWPAEALKAQSYAARSYALWNMQGHAAERFDVDDTTQFQVYHGANAEQDNVNQIVDATAGQAIVYGGQVIQAYFFSTCSGWTENNETVWPAGQPLPYLRGIHDVDANGKPYDADSPRFSWQTGALTASQLEQSLNGNPLTAIGHLKTLDLSQRAASGRLLSVKITGTDGTKVVAPDALVARFNNSRPQGVTPLYSTNFDLRWTTLSAVATTQGATPTPASTQPTPTPRSPQPTPTPVYHLEMTQPAPAKPVGPTNQYFPETGHNVGGAFLRFFQQDGGLDIFGYPRTEELLEDGRTVQYFQRAKLEYHVEQAGTPYEVQIALLGDMLTSARRPFQPAAPFASSTDHAYFPETGHGLHFSFLTYWQTHGGLDVFGYPTSEEMTENGFTVQYFQRARFEYHPELPDPYQVSLGLLGDQLLAQRYWLK